MDHMRKLEEKLDKNIIFPNQIFSLSLSLFLSLYLSIYLSLPLSLSLLIFLSRSLFLSVSVISPSNSLSFSFSIYLSPPLSLYLSITLSLSLSACLSSPTFSICPSIYFKFSVFRQSLFFALSSCMFFFHIILPLYLARTW